MRFCAYFFLTLAISSQVFAETDLKNWEVKCNEEEAIRWGFKGDVYSIGDKASGISQDFNKAFEYYKKSCLCGYAPRCHNLAYCYYLGEGVNQSYSKAVEYLQKACDEGEFGLACYNLALMYRDGDNLNQSYLKAAEYFKKACDFGAGLGCPNLSFTLDYDMSKEELEEYKRKFE